MRLPDPARRSGRSRHWAWLSHAWEGRMTPRCTESCPWPTPVTGWAARNVIWPGREASRVTTAPRSSALSRRSLSASLPRSWALSQLEQLRDRGGRLGVRVRRPGPGGDRGAELGQLPTAGHHHARCEPHHLGLVPRRVGRVGL